MAAPSHPRSPLQALEALIGRQRAALVQRDPAELEASSQALVNAFAALQAAGVPPLDPRSAMAVSLRAALAVNADLLSRCAAANARALAVLFDAPVTYGPPGSTSVGNPSRKLDSA